MNIRNFIFAGAVCAACSLTAFGQTVPKGDTPATTTKSESKPATIKTGSSSNLVIVIPLKGVVGPTLDGDEWFSATDFKKTLEKAEKQKPAAVILEINSPGGRVDVEEQIIQAILDSAGRGTRIVAWVTDAGSAAALITIACKEIFVKPSSRIGAAVTIVSGSKGTSSLKKLMQGDEELAAKYESFQSAIHKAAAEATGRSPAIAAAMRDMSKELWWSNEGGFSDQQRAPTDERIDGPKEVLTLTAGTMEKTGLAKQKNSLDEVIASLAVPSGGQTKRMDSDIQSSPKKLRAFIKRLEDREKDISRAQADSNPSRVASLRKEYEKTLLEARALCEKP